MNCSVPRKIPTDIEGVCTMHEYHCLFEIECIPSIRFLDVLFDYKKCHRISFDKTVSSFSYSTHSCEPIHSETIKETYGCRSCEREIKDVTKIVIQLLRFVGILKKKKKTPIDIMWTNWIPLSYFVTGRTYEWISETMILIWTAN